MKTMIAAAALAATFATPALAASNCMATDKMRAYLAEEYGEEPFFIGLRDEGAVLVEIWVGKYQSLTVLHTTASDGISCIATFAVDVDILVGEPS